MKNYNALLSRMYHMAEDLSLGGNIADKIADKFVRDNIGLMYLQIGRELGKLPHNLQCAIASTGTDEILNEAVLITLQGGIKNYDPAKGPFPPYMARIVGQATRNVIDQIRPFHVPRGLVYIREKIKDIWGVEPEKLSDNPETMREIARTLNTSQIQIRNALRLPKRAAETSYTTTGNVDSHRGPDSVTQEVIDSERRQKIKEALGRYVSTRGLNEKDLTVLDGKFGLGLGYYEPGDGRCNEHTEIAIAKQLGWTREWVRQRKERGLAALRGMEEMQDLASCL